MGILNAGCNSTVMSLWSIDDCTTTDFMEYLYSYYDNGFSKDLALQKAKINYLENAKKSQQHPFYWAPFICYGSMDPISSTNYYGVRKYGVGLSVFCVLFSIVTLLFLRKLQQRSN